MSEDEGMGYQLRLVKDVWRRQVLGRDRRTSLVAHGASGPVRRLSHCHIALASPQVGSIFPELRAGDLFELPLARMWRKSSSKFKERELESEWVRPISDNG